MGRTIEFFLVPRTLKWYLQAPNVVEAFYFGGKETMIVRFVVNIDQGGLIWPQEKGTKENCRTKTSLEFKGI